MEDQISKNIIIILLALLVLGLLGVIYISNQDYSVLSGEEVAEEQVAEEENVNGEEENEETAPITTGGAATPPQEEVVTSIPVPVVTKLPQTDIGEVDLDSSMVIVTYTDSGFIPPVVEVVAGNSVTFINSSTKPMWVTSENHPTAKGQVYPGFAQGKSVSKGGTYTFNFTQVGVWGYKNLNLEQHLGAISVITQ